MIVFCERLDDFGRGICKLDGKIVFVSNLLPSEKAEIKIVLNKKNYMVGEIVELIDSSRDRVKSRCVYNSCGCSLMNMNYEKTLDYKKNKVISILKKFAGISLDDIKIYGSPSVYGYRNKITLKVKNGKLGYFKNGSNELIEIDKCLIVSDKINELISILKKEDLSNVSSIVIKDMDGILIDVDGIMDVSNLKKYCDSIYLSGKNIYGKKEVINKILDYNFLVSNESFFQINNMVTENLYSKVLDYAGSGDRVLDLYCGTGTISILLSKYYNDVIGIEINESSVKCANENKRINYVSNVSFRCGDANILCRGIDADLVVVDPARNGLSRDGIKNILDISPSKIIYVSCNPVTLARDLKELSSRYNLVDISLFDMFPWTYHVECVCLLYRKN